MVFSTTLEALLLPSLSRTCPTVDVSPRLAILEEVRKLSILSLHLSTYRKICLCKRLGSPLTSWIFLRYYQAVESKDDERLTIKGFYAGADKYNDQFPMCIKAMAEYITNGSVVFDETYEKGFDKFPEAMLGMLAGKNTGKMLVDLR